MAKAPPASGVLDGRNRKSPSPAERATFAVEISLTSGAGHYASGHALTAALQALRLPADCAVGDVVSAMEGGARHDFYVIRRRWIVGEEDRRLEVTLDHPVRQIR